MVVEVMGERRRYQNLTVEEDKARVTIESVVLNGS